MLIRLTPVTLSLVVLLAAPAFPGRADELSNKAKAILKANQRSVVTVELVIKSRMSFGGMGGQSNESRREATASVIDPSGLCVLSLSATDPGGMVRAILGGMSGDDSRFKMDTELSGVRILLDDGTEIPAEVVLRDKDLDLAFIRPKAKLAVPLPALDLAHSGKAEVFDQVISLNRLGSVAGRAYAGSVERISAVVKDPRLFYIPENSPTRTDLGSPAFTLDGKVLGVFVMRSRESGGGGGALSLLSNPQEAFTAIILPAQDVLKAAKQAPPTAAAVGDQGKEKAKP
jgi:S1-C subfamily serine protease